jgi:signal peptidase I
MTVGLASVLIGRHPRVTLLRIAIVVATATLLFGWVLLPLRLSGISMLPTYSEGTLTFANRAAYWRSAPARGDVVAIRLAGTRAMYVKRIVGLPGERIEIVEGTVLIDEVPLIEPTVTRRARWTLPPVEIGPEEYYVIGDNRSMRPEHHDFGRVRRDGIAGKLLF